VRKTSLFIVDMYVVKTERQKEFLEYIQRFSKYKNENPKKFKECKSWKIFRQAFGSISGAYVEMMEFDNMAEAEKWGARMRKDEVMTKFREQFMPLIEVASHSTSLWNCVV
jgi:hypothetical protein